MDIFTHLPYFVHSNLDSVPLFVGMGERSIDVHREKPEIRHDVRNSKKLTTNQKESPDQETRPACIS